MRNRIRAEKGEGDQLIYVQGKDASCALWYEAAGWGQVEAVFFFSPPLFYSAFKATEALCEKAVDPGHKFCLFFWGKKQFVVRVEGGGREWGGGGGGEKDFALCAVVVRLRAGAWPWGWCWCLWRQARDELWGFFTRTAAGTEPPVSPDSNWTSYNVWNGTVTINPLLYWRKVRCQTGTCRSSGWFVYTAGMRRHVEHLD